METGTAILVLGILGLAVASPGFRKIVIVCVALFALWLGGHFVKAGVNHAAYEAMTPCYQQTGKTIPPTERDWRGPWDDYADKTPRREYCK